MNEDKNNLFSFVEKILGKVFRYFSLFFTILSFYVLIGNIYFYNKTSNSSNLPFFYKFLPKINFGLDINGGTQFKIAPDFNKLYAEKYKNFIVDLSETSWNNDFIIKNSVLSENNVEIFFDSKNDLLKFEQERSKPNFDSICCTYSEYNLKAICNICNEKKLKKEETERLISVIKNRINGLQVKEISVTRDGSDGISILIPKGVNLENIKAIILKMAKLSFHTVLNEKDKNQLLELEKKHIATKYKFKDSNQEFFLTSKAAISGDKIQDARAFRDEASRNTIFFKLNSKGRDEFAIVTKNNIGKPLAILLDNEIISMPTIKESIPSGSATISGTFHEDEARNLAIMLKSGSISTDIKIIEERSINFSISENFKQNIYKAILFTSLSVLLFMFLRYRFFGIIAFFTLFLNFIFTFTISAIFGFTITIPSLAGMILMLGMSIDINILTYERMREFKSFSYFSMKHSFDIVQKTIADSNLTTILAVVSLLSFGDSFLKGFSVILITGIISSVFSCFYISKNILAFYFKNHK